MRAVPDTCIGAVLTAFNEPLELWELQVPRELEPGALLVEIETSTICGSDVHIWDGSVATMIPIPLPVIPGHGAGGGRCAGRLAGPISGWRLGRCTVRAGRDRAEHR